MKNIKFALYLGLLLPFLSACKPETDGADAYGNFESREVIVSSEANGKLLRFDVEEGQELKAGVYIGLIDTIPLHLKRLQLLASLQTVKSKTQDARPQIQVYEEQRRNLLREEKRIKALIAENAAPSKQLDDIQGQLEVVNRQIEAISKQESIANRGILSETGPIQAQVHQLDDQIRRSYLYVPIDGTVTLKMAEASELVAAGKPLYKIADLKNMTLRAYISGDQLPNIKIGQKVRVQIDADAKSNRSLPGIISWISSQAEFTPKIVQTKEERVNLVYAIKIKVDNADGSLKMGMPGEVTFKP